MVDTTNIVDHSNSIVTLTYFFVTNCLQETQLAHRQKIPSHILLYCTSLVSCFILLGMCLSDV